MTVSIYARVSTKEQNTENQIEVLKGPQGGLYGRNAIGGAIIITTKKPTQEFSGNITAGIDNGFGYFLRGGVSGPVAENVFFRVAGSYYDTDGFIPNTFLGEDADPVKDYSLRANLLVEATDRLTIDLRGSMNRLRTQGLYYNIVADVNDIADVEVNNPGQNDRDINNVSLKVEYAGDNAVFTSVSSYDTLQEVLTGDAFDFKPIPDSFFFNLFEFLFGPGNGFDLNQSQFLDVEAFSQEVRLASPEDGRAFNWMVGGYLIDTQLHFHRQHDRHRQRRLPGVPHPVHQSAEPAVQLPFGRAGQLRLGAVRQCGLRAEPGIPGRCEPAL